MEVRLSHHQRFATEHLVSEIIHSCQDMRVILINLNPGQVLPPQISSSSVSLHLLSGHGELLSGCDWAPAGPGTMRFYPPSEPHGARATTEPVTVLATLAPRP